MLRILGALLLLTGCVGYSHCCCRELRERLESLYELKRMYEQFYSQVDYQLAAFPEACRATAEAVREPFCSMLRSVYAQTERNTGKPLPQIWEEQMSLWFPRFSLKKEDKPLLTGFARSFGCADKELQKQAIENQIAALLLGIRKAEAHLAEREKMIMSFGVMGGLLLVVILV